MLPAPVYAESEAERLRGEIDVLLLCGGSATDLPSQGPRFAQLFNTVDSFDTHAAIPDYFAAVDKAAKSGGNASLISVGWDPGLFSLNRVYAQSVLPPTTPSGAAASARGIPTRRGACPACWTRGSTPFPLSPPWRRCGAARCLS